MKYAACMTLLLTGAAAAAEPPTWNVGLKAGLLAEGEVHVDADFGEFDAETDSGWLVHVDLDNWVASRFSLGAFVLFASMPLKDATPEPTVLTAGVSLKTRFDLGGVELRPALAIGYQRIDPDEDDIDPTTGLDLGATVDLVAPLQGGNALVISAGFISQPVGGNDDFELTFDPIYYLAGGLLFGG